MTAMKQISFSTLGVLCVVLNFATVTWCQDRTVGRAIIKSGQTNIQANCTGSFGPKCADCNTILTCANIEINKQPCSTINSNTPYCVKNACTDVPPPGCALPFTCTGSGLFPDPNDCRRYYLCKGPSGKSVTYGCPKGFAYESRTGLCKRKRMPHDCQTIDCSRKSNNYVLFAGDRSIMAYCQNVSNKKQTILFRCPDSENMEYNLKSLSCKFKCKAEGRYADRLNCRKFYECYWDGTGFGYNYESCPTGFCYNPDRKQCERRDHCEPEITEDEVSESGSGGGISGGGASGGIGGGEASGGGSSGGGASGGGASGGGTSGGGGISGGGASGGIDGGGASGGGASGGGTSGGGGISGGGASGGIDGGGASGGGSSGGGASGGGASGGGTSGNGTSVGGGISGGGASGGIGGGEASGGGSSGGGGSGGGASGGGTSGGGGISGGGASGGIDGGGASGGGTSGGGTSGGGASGGGTSGGGGISGGGASDGISGGGASGGGTSGGGISGGGGGISEGGASGGIGGGIIPGGGLGG